MLKKFHISKQKSPTHMETLSCTSMTPAHQWDEDLRPWEEDLRPWEEDPCPLRCSSSCKTAHGPWGLETTPKGALGTQASFCPLQSLL